MSTPCGWIDSRLEDLLSDDPGVRSAIAAHTRLCGSCRREVQAYTQVDRLLAAYVTARRIQTARGKPGRARWLFGAAAAVAGVLLALWVGFGARSPGVGRQDLPVIAPPAGAPSAGAPSAGSAADADKTVEDADVPLAKPSAAGPDTAAAAGDPPRVPVSEAQFYVMDAGGYVHTLSDFRGSVIVLGVFDESGTGSQAFRRAYDALPPGSDLRFLAVGLDRAAVETTRGFPVMLNWGSSLLGTRAGEFAILTREGDVYRRGRLSDAGFEETVRSNLAALGVADPDR